MAIISRPFDKNRIENRELAALSTSVMGSTMTDLFVIRSLTSGKNEPMSYDEFSGKVISADTRAGIPAVIMRLAHYGILNVVDSGDTNFKYLLSDGFLELVNEIKSAVQSFPF